MRHLEQLLTSGSLDAAEKLAMEMLCQGDRPAFAHQALGMIAHRGGRYDAAADHFRAAIRHDLPGAHAWANLGASLRASGKLDEADAALRRALAIDPNSGSALGNHANVLYDLARHSEAEQQARTAIAAGARHGGVYLTLGNALFRQGRLFPAMEAFRNALSADGNPVAAQNLASSLVHLGRFDDAVAVYRAALSHQPDPQVHSSYLITLNYHPTLPAERILEAYREFEAIQCREVTRRRNWVNDPDPERRLRVGYVSPDLCNHVVSAFMMPLLEAHDRERFDVVCYADVPKPDDTSRRIASVTRWVGTVGLSDEALAHRIAEDRIDVLVDLAGHSSGNRLRLFARKPAPVQLSYAIGTGSTTGLSAFDGLVADETLLPGDEPLHITEHPAALPRPFVAYAPSPTMPEVGPLPARASGTVTFGHYGRLVRLNDAVLEAWAAILSAVPDSRLRLDSPPLADEQVRADLTRRLVRHGIPAERILLHASKGQPVVWATYNDLDIALDPFPHNAGTTTLEALWMGVPVITMVGRPPVGRIGKSLLEAIGHPEWCAKNRTQYIARALELASDLDHLAAVRQGLRATMAASQLCDVADWTRHMEALYRTRWRAWCERTPTV